MKILTTAKPGSAPWLALHKGKIGGNMAASIMGVGYQTPLQAWAELTGKLEEPPRREPNEDGDEDEVQPSPAEYLEIGTELEESVARLYARRTGRTLIESPGMIQHPTLPWLCCTPDKLIEHCDGHTDAGNLSIKTTGGIKLKDWMEEPPVAAQVQQHVEFACTGMEWGSIAGLIGTYHFRLLWHDTTINPVFMDELMNTLVDFWEHHVLKDIPPTASSDDLPTIKLLAPRDDGETKELTPDVLQRYQMMAELRTQAKALTDEAEEHEAFVKQWFGTAAAAIGCGYKLTYKSQERAGYTVQPGSVRQLRRVKWPNP